MYKCRRMRSITLANRPIFCTNSILESEGAPRTVNRTHATSGSFIDYMIRFREEAFRAQPNAVNDEDDCHLQMLHMVLLRLLKHHFPSSTHHASTKTRPNQFK